MRATRGVLLGLGLLSGCLGGTPISLPEVPEQSSLLLVQRHGETSHAVFLGGEVESLAVREDPLWLGLYPFTPSSLGIQPGDDLTTLAREETQPLLPPDAAWDAETPGAPWRSLMTDEGPWMALSIPKISVDACSDLGGCITEDDPWRCNLDCDIPPPLTPALPTFECPPTWREADGPEGSGVVACMPPAPSGDDCPPGTLRLPTDSACGDLSACPAEPGWPAAPVGAVVRYLDPEAASEGDGSIERPWRTLGAALTDAPDGATVLIGEGTLTAGGVLRDKTLRLVGRCPTETHVEVPETALTCEDSQVELTGLHLTSARPEAALLRLTRCQATLGAVDLEGPGIAVAATGGALWANRLRTRADVGIRSEGTDVELDAWDHGGRVGLDAAQGSAHIAHARLDGRSRPSGAGVTLTGVATATVSDLSAVSFDGVGIQLLGQSRSTRLEDVIMAGRSQDAIVALLSDLSPELPQPILHLTRVGLLDVKVGVWTEGVELIGEDIVVHAVGGSALSVVSSAVWSASTVLTRLWATGMDSPVMRVDDGEDSGRVAVIRGSDWLVGPRDSSANLRHVFRTRSHARVTLSRAYLVPGSHSAYFARCGETRFEDVTVAPGLLTGLWIHAELPSHLTRVRLLGGAEAALVVGIADASCMVSEARLEDVEVTPCDACQAGIQVQQGGRMSGCGVRIRGYKSGLTTEGDAEVDLSESELLDNNVGFHLSSTALVERLARGVRLRNGRNFEFSSP